MYNRYARLFVLMGLILIASSIVEANDKLKPDEIIEKHLQSIGTPEKRSQTLNQVVLCDLQMKSVGTALNYNGKAVLFSAGGKNLWGMNLNSAEYSSDKFAFNGKDVTVAFLRPGVRSILGEFVFTYKKLLKESLLGGVLSTSWALQKSNGTDAKITYDGTSKIDGKEVHALNYSPKGGSDLDIRLFFDKSTFRHIRTEYKRVIGAGLGSIDSSAGRSSQTYRIVEDFSDFKEISGLTLPTFYKIFYSFSGGSSALTSQNRSREIEWTLKVTNVSFNQQVDDSYFEIPGE